MVEYVKMVTDSRLTEDEIKGLLADPNLEVTRIEQSRPPFDIAHLKDLRDNAATVPPPFATQVWNFAVAMAQFAIDGFKTVTRDEYETRITICDKCPTNRRVGWRCMACGCILAAKARIRSETCEDGNWPILDTKTSEEKSV
jgi:hypothetical protein